MSYDDLREVENFLEEEEFDPSQIGNLTVPIYQPDRLYQPRVKSEPVDLGILDSVTPYHGKLGRPAKDTVLAIPRQQFMARLERAFDNHAGFLEHFELEVARFENCKEGLFYSSILNAGQKAYYNQKINPYTKNLLDEVEILIRGYLTQEENAVKELNKTSYDPEELETNRIVANACYRNADEMMEKIRKLQLEIDLRLNDAELHIFGKLNR